MLPLGGNCTSRFSNTHGPYARDGEENPETDADTSADPAAAAIPVVNAIARVAADSIRKGIPAQVIPRLGVVATDRPVVVIADDDPVVRRLLEVTVKNAGCDVRVAQDGEEALRLMSETEPRLAILDISMPFRSGLEVGRALRDREQAVPIIFLTSHTQEADVVEGFLAGAVDYVFKPFSPRELQARIKSMLMRR